MFFFLLRSRSSAAMDFCIADALHLFQIAAILNLALYFATCVKFDSFISKAVFSLDLALLLKTIIETELGERHWPQDVAPNLFIVFCFMAFFYFTSANMWAVVFLLFGLLAVQGFWEPVRDQIYTLLSKSFDLVLDETHSPAIFACVIVFILTICAISVFFSVPFVQITSMAMVFGVKAVGSYKVLRLGDRPICCSPDADFDQCPIWFDRWQWIAIGVLIPFRLALGKFIQKHKFCGKYSGYKVLPEEEGENDLELSKKETKSKPKPVKSRLQTHLL